MQKTLAIKAEKEAKKIMLRGPSFQFSLRFNFFPIEST